MLSFEELKQIAELVHHPGYNLLLTAIQAYTDDLSTDLQTAAPAIELQILAKWRVAHEILALLKNNPANIALEVKNELALKEQMYGPQMPEQHNVFVPSSLSPAQINALRAAYERKLKEK